LLDYFQSPFAGQKPVNVMHIILVSRHLLIVNVQNKHCWKLISLFVLGIIHVHLCQLYMNILVLVLWCLVTCLLLD